MPSLQEEFQRWLRTYRFSGQRTAVQKLRKVIRQMKSVIVTGGIGTGKSYVSGRLACELNAPLLNYDKEWHNQLSENQGLKQAIIKKFGDVVTFGDLHDEIDRKKLAQLVFSSPDIMQEYMDTISVYLKKMEEAITSDDMWKTSVFEIPVGFNCIPMDAFKRDDAIFVGVFASRETQIKRIVMRSKWKVTAQEAAKRIDFQPKPTIYMHLCDVCFWNEDDSNLRELVNIVKEKRGE